MNRRLILTLVCLLMAGTVTTAVAGDSVERFSLRDGAAFNVLVIDPGDTKTAVILFAGGNGVVNIPDDGDIGTNNNFLVRSRDAFADKGLMTSVIDAPENLRDSVGLKQGFRVSAEHASDIAAVIARLRARGANKVWLIGTSRGSISVVGAASLLGSAPKGPDGIVLTSSVVTPGGDPDTSLDADLSLITIPALIAHHEKDACFVSLFADIGPMKDGLSNSTDLELMAIEGGKAGKASNACKGKSHHGFWTIEDKVVSDIANWIKAR